MEEYREYWIKGLTAYQTEPANIGKTMHVIEYAAHEQDQLIIGALKERIKELENGKA